MRCQKRASNPPMLPPVRQFVTATNSFCPALLQPCAGLHWNVVSSSCFPLSFLILLSYNNDLLPVCQFVTNFFFSSVNLNDKVNDKLFNSPQNLISLQARREPHTDRVIHQHLAILPLWHPQCGTHIEIEILNCVRLTSFNPKK